MNGIPHPEPMDELRVFGALLSEYQLDPSDFGDGHYVGLLTVAEIRQLAVDDDMRWLQVRTPKDLQNFRDGSFEDACASDFPPVIVVTYPVDGRSRTELREGRGRVNCVNAYGLRLNVWHFVHRNCKQKL